MQVTLETYATEPISYTEAKEYLKLSNDVEQTLIESLIVSARERCERYAGQSFLPREVVCYFESIDDWRELPYQPNASNIVVKDEDDTTLTIDVDYEIRGLNYKQIRIVSSTPITVTYDAGFATCPEIAKLAMLKEISSNYWNRETDMTGVGAESRMLLNSIRRMTFLGVL